MTRYFLFLFLALASLVPGRAEIITLDAPSETGGLLDVSVNLTDVFSSPHNTDAFLGYGFDVSFDSSVVSYLGETSGALFDDLSDNPGISAEVAGVASSILLEPGDFTEPLNLAVLHFQVIGVGPTTISISGDVSNLDQGLIYLSGSDPISASLAVPEPNGLWLLSLGLLLPAGWRRMRSQSRS